MQALSHRQAGRLGARPSVAARRMLVVPNVQANGGTDPRNSGMEKGMFGEDWGARDPFAGEIATNFGENVLGNFDTQHIVKPPDMIRRVLGLSSRRCQDNVAGLRLLSEDERELLRNQVPGWKVVPAAAPGQLGIQQTWVLKDAEAAAAMLERVSKVAADEGHVENLELTHAGAELVARLSTAALGGLTENDFVVASKLNDLNFTDLLPKRKQRFWA